MREVNVRNGSDSVMAPFPAAGRAGVLVRDDRSGRVLVDHDADAVFETASIIKLGVLAVLCARADDGVVPLDGPVVVEEGDRAPGDGILRELSLPVTWTPRDLAVAMTVLSDNTATNTLLRVLGVEAINAQLAAWGLAITRSRGPIRPREPGAPGIGVTTARECVELLDGLRLARFASAETSAWAMRVLEGQQDGRAMSRFLRWPARCAHKTGTWSTYRHDVGVLLADDGSALATLAFLTEGMGRPVEWHDHPAVIAIGHATVAAIRALDLPIALTPDVAGG
ncbi:MAG: serine hydrolase [Chloroflexota bacterium]